MRALACLLSAGILILTQDVSAQMQPHHAEYILRLGMAANAPRVGMATEDLELDCDVWHLQRDVKGELPISATWKFDAASTLVSDETRSGDDLRYRSQQFQNGTEHVMRGKVQRADGELRAETASSGSSTRVQLPALTRMPVASIGYIIDKLRGGSASFSTLSFDAQMTGDAFRVDVKRIDNAAIRRRPPSDEPIDVPGRSWPVLMSIARGDKQQQRPLFTLKARLFDSGVLDRVTVDADVVTVTADLKALAMHAPPSCP